MNFTLRFCLLPVLVLLSACESLDSGVEGVRERWAARYEGRTRVFEGEARPAYEAARKSAEALGFRLVKGGVNQGFFEAVGGLETDNSLRSARQLTLRVRISSQGLGAAVNVLLLEVFESDSERQPGMGTETPLKDSATYELFFAHMTEKLGAPVDKAPAPGSR